VGQDRKLYHAIRAPEVLPGLLAMLDMDSWLKYPLMLQLAKLLPQLTPGPLVTKCFTHVRTIKFQSHFLADKISEMI